MFGALPSHAVELSRAAEFDRIIDRLNERGETMNAVVRNQEIQFQRIAQLQAEFDLFRRALERLALS